MGQEEGQKRTLLLHDKEPEKVERDESQVFRTRSSK